MADSQSLERPRIDPMLRLPEVESITGRKRSSIYRDIKAGTFPVPVKLGARAVGFPASQVQAWITGRIADSKARGQQ